MITFLQIAIILLLMALFGMLIGYLIGKLGCKRVSKDTMIQKGAYCEGEYAQEHNLNAQTDHLELEQLKDSASDWETEKDSNKVESNTSASTFVSKVATENEKESVSNDDANSELIVENELDSEGQNQAESKEEFSSDAEVASEDSDKVTPVNEEFVEDNQDKSSEKEDSEELSNENTTTENSSSEGVEKEELESEEVSGKLDEVSTNEASQNSYAPQFLSEPKDGKADNLCEIKGIGKVIDEKLKNLGVFHFEQIAKWTQEDVAWIDEHLAFKGRVGREKWIEQAQLLAKGEETEFSQRVQRGEVESSKKD